MSADFPSATLRDLSNDHLEPRYTVISSVSESRRRNRYFQILPLPFPRWQRSQAFVTRRPLAEPLRPLLEYLRITGEEPPTDLSWIAKPRKFPQDKAFRHL